MYMYMPSYFLVGGIRSSVLSLVQFSLSLLWNEMYGNMVFKSRSDISHTDYRKENYTSDKHSETLLVLVLHLLTLSTMKCSLFFWKMPKAVLEALLRSFLPLYETIFKCREYVLNEFPYIIFSGSKFKWTLKQFFSFWNEKRKILNHIISIHIHRKCDHVKCYGYVYICLFVFSFFFFLGFTCVWC